MDDLISRAAVLEELADLYWTEERFLTFKDVDGVFDRIKALPSAQPERIRARWEKQVLGWKCSNCTASTNDFGAREFNFCPACGAYMRGGR